MIQSRIWTPSYSAPGIKPQPMYASPIGVSAFRTYANLASTTSTTTTTTTTTPSPDTLLNRSPVYVISDDTKHSGAGFYKDTGSTLCVDGDTLNQANDATGNGNKFVQATSGARCTVHSQTNAGKSFFSFQGNGTSLYLPSAATVAHGIGTGDLTLGFIINLPSIPAGYSAIWECGLYSPGMFTAGGDHIDWYHGADHTISTGALSTNAWISYIVTRVSGQVQLYINAVAAALNPTVSNSIANDIVTLLSDKGGGEYGNAKIAENWLIAAGSTSGQVTSLYAQQTSLYGV